MSSKTIINRYKCKQVGGNVTVITYENTSIMFDKLSKLGSEMIREFIPKLVSGDFTPNNKYIRSLKMLVFNEKNPCMFYE